MPPSKPCIYLIAWVTLGHWTSKYPQTTDRVQTTHHWLQEKAVRLRNNKTGLVFLILGGR